MPCIGQRESGSEPDISVSQDGYLPKEHTSAPMAAPVQSIYRRQPHFLLVIAGELLHQHAVAF